MHTLHAKDPLEYLDTDLLDADGIPMDKILVVLFTLCTCPCLSYSGHDYGGYYGHGHGVLPGNYCPIQRAITSETQCRAAATASGKEWGGAWNGPGDHQFCLLRTGDEKIFFNTAAAEEASATATTHYASLCKLPALPPCDGNTSVGDPVPFVAATFVGVPDVNITANSQSGVTACTFSPCIMR